MNEGLYFDDKLDHSLINPNLLQAHGVDAYDNPYNCNDTMRIQGHDLNDENIVIPLLAEGVDISFEIRTPSRWMSLKVAHIYI